MFFSSQLFKIRCVFYTKIPSQNGLASSRLPRGCRPAPQIARRCGTKEAARELHLPARSGRVL